MAGVVLFASHRHRFMQPGANRIIELTPSGIIDRLMEFDRYLQDGRVKSLKEELYGSRVEA